MLNKPPELSYEHAGTLSIEDHFDRSTGSWKQPFEGPLWSVVAHAHQKGMRGKDRTVAIIDSGFDLGIKRLSEAALGSCAQESRLGGASEHGTLVALLINEIAPEATLDLYEVSMGSKPSAVLIEKALRTIEKSGADIVNLSLGHSTEQGGTGVCECKLAAEVARFAQANKLVVAACGNEFGPLSCPAQIKSVLSVGYSNERREINWDGEVPVREVSIADRPSFAQSMLANVLVRQPPDIAGSSFAAPMICGLAAISPPLTHLAEWSDVIFRAGSASEMMALGDPKLQEKYPWEEPIAALGALPAPGTSPLLSWMTHWIFINYALYLMTQDYARALEQADKAVEIAPWSDNAWSSFAGINMHLVDVLDLSKQDHRAAAIGHLQKAVNAYDQALVIRKNHEVYTYWRSHCLKRLAELTA
jgi:tetratricopeptide (TPR) repeat protein